MVSEGRYLYKVLVRTASLFPFDKDVGSRWSKYDFLTQYMTGRVKCFECGAIFDILKKAKKANKKAALYKCGSLTWEHASEILDKVCRSNVPMWEGEKVLFNGDTSEVIPNKVIREWFNVPFIA